MELCDGKTPGINRRTDHNNKRKSAVYVVVLSDDCRETGRSQAKELDGGRGGGEDPTHHSHTHPHTTHEEREEEAIMFTNNTVM